MTFIGPSAHASIHLPAWLQSCLPGYNTPQPPRVTQLHTLHALQVAILQAPYITSGDLTSPLHYKWRSYKRQSYRCYSPTLMRFLSISSAILGAGVKARAATQVRHHHLCNRNQWLSLSLWPNFNLELSFKQQLVEHRISSPGQLAGSI